jgi:hypothetical protein
MKATISVTRKTQYSSIVEMDEETFKRLDAALDSGDRVERKKAEQELNNLIDVSDWQDDELYNLDDFCEFKPEESA